MRTPHHEQLIASTAAGAGSAPASPAAARRTRGDVDADGAQRRCILSGDHGGRDAFIRLALSPDGMLVPDVMARAPGRGAWLGVDRTTLCAAMAKGKLKAAVARAFKGASIGYSDALADDIDAAFRRQLLAQLGLAAKAGVLLTGAEKIDQAARSGAVAWLGHAADAAEDGRRKRDQSWRVGENCEGSDLLGVILPVDRTGLSVALGRDNVVHVAISDATWAGRIAQLLERWHLFAGSASGTAGSTQSGVAAQFPAAAAVDGTKLN